MFRRSHLALGRPTVLPSLIATLVIVLAVALGGSAARATVVSTGQDAPSRGAPAAGDPPPAAFARLRQQAESLSARGRLVEALRTLQLALRAAPTVEDEASIWFRIGAAYSLLGRFAPALDAYTRQLALVAADPSALANSAELLMALGRLDESIDAYREAVAIEERARDRRSHIAGLAFGYLGLGAALDRSGRADASREAVGRALALDPGLGVLRLAEQGSGELFVIPAEDASYYLALARMAQGRVPDALTALRSYLNAVAKRGTGEGVSLRYLERARAHVAALTKPVPPPSPAPPPVSRGWRVVREATLSAEGPLVAPLIDAAWRLDPRLIDACLAELAPAVEGGGELRLALAIVFDGGGRVRSVAAEAAAPVPAGVVSCIEAALMARLRTPRPAHNKITRARLELVLAPAAPSGV